jgi:hypothetical protein
VKYAYQEWPHPADTASPHSQKVERRRQHGYTIISFKIDITNKVTEQTWFFKKILFLATVTLTLDVPAMVLYATHRLVMVNICAKLF